jgi:hypothetical protein
MKIKESELMLLREKKLLFKLYNVLVRDLLYKNIIFFSLRINLTKFFYNKTFKSSPDEMSDVQKCFESLLKMLVGG